MLEIEFTHLIKNIYEECTTNIIFKGGRLNIFPLRSRNRQRCPFSPLLFYIVSEALTRAVEQKQKTKHPAWKGRSKTTSLHRWHDFVCRKS